MKQQPPIQERFWSGVDKRGPDDCWVWTRTRSRKGYGRLNAKRNGKSRPEQAHRVAWEIHNGPIPPKMDICHHCDNPPCCNPAHLFVGTRRDNMQDAARKGRVCKTGRPHTVCRNGHQRTSDNVVTNSRGDRLCLACLRNRQRVWREGHKDQQAAAWQRWYRRQRGAVG